MNPEAAAPVVGGEGPHERAPAETTKRSRWSERSFLHSLQSLSTTLVIAVFVITFIAQAFQIPSESMENTLLIGDYLLVDKLQYGPTAGLTLGLPYRAVQRGDIVVFRWPVNPNQHFVKRIIALPGDRVRMRNGTVYVNGEAALEPYVLVKPRAVNFFRDNFPTEREMSPQVNSAWWSEFPSLVRHGELLVPEDHYFVLGDNRNESSDSRYWGLVPRESIVGRPLFVYFSVDPAPPGATTAAAGDRIGRFTARIWRLPETVRWRRAFHFVR